MKKRDAKGDVIFGNYNYDGHKTRKALSTYVFHYFDEILKRHKPYFNLRDPYDDDIEKVKHMSDFYELELYKMPDHPPYDFYITSHNRQLDLLIEYFKEVFEERAFIDGHMPQHKYFRVILPKSKYNEIMNCINDYNLLHIRDLLFEVISIAQHKYVEDIAFWDKPENNKLITTAKKETQKAIDVISKTEIDDWMNDMPGSRPPSKLNYINFVFNTGPIKIEHKCLAMEFITHFKNYYDNLHYKNWKLDLERFPERFEENLHDQNFKYRLVKSFYNLLSKYEFFKVSAEAPTPNSLMLCIARLVQFCEIPVGSPDESDEIIKKHIRNWLRRKDFIPAITYAEPPQYESKLSQFFPDDLKIEPKKEWRADAIQLGYFLGKRFNIQHLVPELINIAQSLNDGRIFRGHQITAGGIQQAAPFPEFDNFRKLINAVKNKEKITSLKFKLEGDNTEYDLLQRLPLHLIEQSIKEYSEEHQVEIDTDLYKTTLTDMGDGSFSVNKADCFNLPEDRFMVRFVKSFYDFLLDQAPPDESDYLPSERYYDIISLMLRYTRFFYNQTQSEWFMQEKVKQWHNMAQGR